MTKVEKKEKFVKYWELEEPTVLQTTKNEIRFFNQHGKVQVYPKIQSGRGIGKGATINLDTFELSDVTKFKELFTAMTQTEIFETHKSYWDHEEPVILSNDSNEIRFYQEHGKIQVYPKISVGRGIGRGASINMDVAASLRQALTSQMFAMLDNILGVDMTTFEPVNDFEEFTVVTEKPVSAPAELNEFELFQLFQKFARMSEEEIKEHAVNTLFSNEKAKAFTVNTLNSYVFEEAVAILHDELSTLVEPYNFKEMFKLTPDEDGLQISTLVDREFNMEWEEVFFTFIELNSHLMENDIEEEEPVESDDEEYNLYTNDEDEDELPEEEPEEEPVQEQAVITPPPAPVKEEQSLVTSKDISLIPIMSDPQLKAEYTKYAFTDVKDYDPGYTVALFEEVLARKKAGKEITL